MAFHREKRPTSVPPATTAKQVGDIRVRWSWTEPAVWTKRMLTALEEGVKGGVWFSLMDKVYSQSNLECAYEKVRSNRGAAGCDHQSVMMYGERWEANNRKLSDQLRQATYRPQTIRRVHIPKPGSRETRPLGIPTVRDRVVQTALRKVIEPVFERDFAQQSYGFRPGRNGKDALRRVDALLKSGYRYVVDADLQGYFDTIVHEDLMKLVERKVADGRVLNLIRAFLTQRVMDGMETWTPTRGSPQGAVISPLLSNIYLDPLDHLMADAGIEMVRYADDFVILCRRYEEAKDALEQVRAWTAQAGLKLHAEKTHIADTASDGFEFLGYVFKQGKRTPRKKSLRKLRESIRGKTRRVSGRSLPYITGDVNRILRGWFEYFKHGSWIRTYKSLDGWTRRRLRRILMKRQKVSHHNGKGYAHRRWPNRYFAELGLLSLETAYAQACQSARGKTTDRRAVCGRSACTVRREGRPG